MERTGEPEARAVLSPLARLATHADRDAALLDVVAPSVPAFAGLLEHSEAGIRARAHR